MQENPLTWCRSMCIAGLGCVRNVPSLKTPGKAISLGFLWDDNLACTACLADLEGIGDITRTQYAFYHPALWTQITIRSGEHRGLHWHLCHHLVAAPNSEVEVSSPGKHSVRHSDDGSVNSNSLLFWPSSFTGFPTNMSPSTFEHSVIVTTVQDREEMRNFKC